MFSPKTILLLLQIESEIHEIHSISSGSSKSSTPVSQPVQPPQHQVKSLFPISRGRGGKPRAVDSDHESLTAEAIFGSSGDAVRRESKFFHSKTDSSSNESHSEQTPKKTQPAISTNMESGEGRPSLEVLSKEQCKQIFTVNLYHAADIASLIVNRKEIGFPETFSVLAADVFLTVTLLLMAVTVLLHNHTQKLDHIGTGFEIAFTLLR